MLLAPVGLHGKDVGDRVGQLSGQLVLGAGRPLVQVQDALVHDVGDDSVHREHGHEHAGVNGYGGKQDEAGEGDRAQDGKEREVHGLEQLGIAGHELGGLAHERAAEAVGVKRQRLVAQAVEGHGGKVVVHGDLQLPERVVLKLATCLAGDVDANERRDVGTEHREDLIGGHRLGRDAVDDEAHHVGVAIGEETAEPDGRGHERHEQPKVIARRQPVIVQATPRQRLLLRHRISLSMLRWR